MNEVVLALPLLASVMWSLRPRPPVRHLAPVPDTTPTSDRVERRDAGRRARRRLDGGATLALAHWCEGVARAVRGGDSLRLALERVQPSAAAETRVDAIRRRTAGHADDAPRSPDVALVAAVVSACLDQGGPSAEPLDRAAGVLRSRAAERAERRVQSAQARMSAVVLTWLPVVMLAVVLITSAPVRRIVASPTGAVLVVAGGVLNLLGWWWMRTIVDRASR